MQMHELIISATGSVPWRQELAGGVRGDKKSQAFWAWPFIFISPKMRLNYLAEPLFPDLEEKGRKKGIPTSVHDLEKVGQKLGQIKNSYQPSGVLRRCAEWLRRESVPAGRLQRWRRGVLC
jgi:hypothetical protein